MEQTAEKIRLNATSRAILVLTAALGIGVVVFSAPTSVAALDRGKLKPVASMQTLSSAPGISLTRAYGADDEDCVAVAHGGGATPNRMICR